MMALVSFDAAAGSLAVHPDDHGRSKVLLLPVIITAMLQVTNDIGKRGHVCGLQQTHM
jgi:hypothetical protein